MLKVTGHTAGTRPIPDLSDSKAEPQSHGAQVLPRLRGLSQAQRTIILVYVGYLGSESDPALNLGKEKH